MPFLYIANWKMNLRHNAATAWVQTNHTHLKSLASGEKKIILCPSFDALAPIAHLVKNSPIALGAQNVSRHRDGAFTGEVSAQSLADLGCTYCIVGHSERRQHHHENDLNVAAKVERLLEVGITPIICIGETKEQHQAGETKHVLEKQLDFVVDVLNQMSGLKPKICIAYEPVWSIGTGQIPDANALIDTFTWLTTLIKDECPETQAQLIYGGSVNAENAAQLKEIDTIQGFLIGSASLDFQKFKNIVS